MGKFKVEVEDIRVYRFTIEADTIENAIAIARDEPYNDRDLLTQSADVVMAEVEKEG